MNSRLSQRFLLLWSTLAVAGGCSQILGISDYEVDPKLDASGGGNAGGESSGGKNSAAGSQATMAGQPMSEGGTGGEPMPGTAGANDGGAAGAAPVAKFQGCDGTPFQGNEAVLRSCILRVGCLQWLWPTETISRCVSQNSQNVYEGTKCTLDAETCDDITKCEGKHLEPSFCGSGASAKTGMYCNGDEVVDCDGYVPYARDCVKEGGKCHDFGVDLNGNGTVDCALPDVTSCTDTTDSQVCGGPANEYAYQCEGDVAYGSKCTNFAAGCRSVGGDVGCYYPLNTCTTEGVTCSNDRATWCDGDTKVTFDCASVGLSCETSGDYTDDGERQCLAPGCSNDDVTSCQESCSGSKLTLCYGGAPLTVDCKDYGFKRCAEYDYDCSSGSAINDCVGDETISFAQCE